MSEDAVNSQERSSDSLKAYNLLAQGKRNMICNEFNTAVNQYQEACELLAKWYGEMGKELAEPYFCYGSALLELARAESGVFGSALPAMDKDDDDDDEDGEGESSEEQGEKTSDDNEDGESGTTKENSADESASQDGSQSGEKKEEKAEVAEKKEEKAEAAEKEEKQEGDAKKEEKPEGDAKKETEKADTAKAGCSKDENGADEDEEEDDGNLKLAWEMLELAKVIFLRSDARQEQLRAADAFMKLGEIGLESETIEGAIEDLKSSLDIRLKYVEPHSRVLAETYYQLGMAYGMAGDHDLSAANYKKAAQAIEAKIVLLEKAVEEAANDKGKAPASADDPFANAQDELKELRELLPDMIAKVEEAEAEAKVTREEAEKFAAMAFGDLLGSRAGGSSSSGFGASPFGSSSSTSASASGSGSSSFGQPQAPASSAAPASSVRNITHLVRKKRKQEGEGEDSAVEVKRPRPENSEEETSGSSRPGQQEQGAGESASSSTEKQVAPTPVAPAAGENA